MDPGLIPEEAAAIVHAEGDDALEMERQLLEPTDNGWVEGDPLDQPDNLEGVRDYG